MLNAKLDDSQAGIKIARRNINNLRCADDITLMAEREEELKSLLMRVNKKSEKTGLKLSMKGTEIMASGPVTSSQIEGNKWSLWQILFSWPPELLWMVTAVMKWKTLAPWRKAMTNLETILKSRDITLLTEVLIVQPVFSPVVMYGCESRTIEKVSTGTSLLAQWLRLWAPNAGGPGSIPGQGTRSHMLQLRPGAAK